ncbi:MAG: histidine phosphatase family protein [Bdellovibrionales bacterium]|nr:histidine phosphatase family protein [Bdellovibrionales bacterium]
MQVILARHGNTFETASEAVWAGSKQDFPLVSRGKQQARELAAALHRNSIQLAAIYCGPLVRTREYAQIVSEELNWTGEIRHDLRLNEIDYGLWGGLSSDQVIKEFGSGAVSDWTESSVWPKDAHWQPSAQKIIQEVQELVSELSAHYSKEQVLLISSNGRLRYFLTLVKGEFEKRVDQRQFAMKTGHIGILDIQDRLSCITCWNLDPVTW